MMQFKEFLLENMKHISHKTYEKQEHKQQNTITDYIPSSYKGLKVTYNNEVQDNEIHYTQFLKDSEESDLKYFKEKYKNAAIFKNNILEQVEQTPPKEITPEVVPKEPSIRLPNTKYPAKRVNWADYDKEHGKGALRSINFHNDDQVAKVMAFAQRDGRLPFDINKLSPEHKDSVKNVERTAAIRSKLSHRVSEVQRPDGKKSIINFHASIHAKARAYLRVGSYDKSHWDDFLDEINQHFAKNKRLLAHEGNYIIHSPKRNLTVVMRGDARKDGVAYSTIVTVLSPGMKYTHEDEDKKPIFPPTVLNLE